MLIAILSDSHGRVDNVRQALELLAPFSPSAYFHCGDVGGEDVLALFAGLPLHFVWGNTDAPSGGTRAFCETVGLPLPDGPVRITLDGKSIAMFHGHENAFSREIRAPRTDYIFHGHTHEKTDYRIGRTRVINPGALHRARVKTVATLDLAADELRFLALE